MIKQFHQRILHIFSPPFCANCKHFLDEPTILCVECKKMVRPIVSKSIVVTPSVTMSVIAIGAYIDPLKRMILAKSWGSRAVSFQLGELIWDMSYIRQQSFDIIVPIPLHWSRYAWRGYNQAESIAHVIAEKSGKPVVSLLARTRRTPFQSYVAAYKRKSNVEHVFALRNADQYTNKKILLVDDLMTTGSTLKYAAKQLISLKPESINAVVAARVI